MLKLAATSGLTSLRPINKVSRYAENRRSGRISKSRRSWCRVISFWNFLVAHSRVDACACWQSCRLLTLPQPQAVH